MTKHDWIVLGGILLGAFSMVCAVVYGTGSANQALGQIDRRVERMELKLDDVHERTSRIEGQITGLRQGSALARED